MFTIHKIQKPFFTVIIQVRMATYHFWHDRDCAHFCERSHWMIGRKSVIAPNTIHTVDVDLALFAIFISLPEPYSHRITPGLVLKIIIKLSVKSALKPKNSTIGICRSQVRTWCFCGPRTSAWYQAFECFHNQCSSSRLPASDSCLSPDLQGDEMKNLTISCGAELIVRRVLWYVWRWSDALSVRWLSGEVES